jgi:hypothetical protein
MDVAVTEEFPFLVIKMSPYWLWFFHCCLGCQGRNLAGSGVAHSEPATRVETRPRRLTLRKV